MCFSTRTGFSRARRSASPEQLAPMSWSMVADGDAHCEIRWEIAHCLFASADNISELRISDIHSWRDTVFEVVAYVIDPFYYTGRKVLHRYVAVSYTHLTLPTIYSV